MFHEFHFPLQIEMGDDPSNIVQVWCIEVLVQLALSEVKFLIQLIVQLPTFPREDENKFPLSFLAY